MSDNSSPANPVIDEAALAALKARTNGTASPQGAASQGASPQGAASQESLGDASRATHMPADDGELWRELVAKISEYSGLDSEDITPETRIADSGITSLSLIEISIRIEDAFGVCLNDETVMNFDTFGDFFRYIKEHRK